MPPCDVAVFVKERPRDAYRQALEQGCRVLYMPVDFYRSQAQLDADAPFLASCAGLLVHSRRLGSLLARHNPAIWYVDHPNLHGLKEKPPYRPDGFTLWVGDFANLPYLLRWCAGTGLPRELRILTNARRTSLRGMAMALALARRLGVDLEVRRDRVNGIPMTEWDPATERNLMASAGTALDVKGGEDDFAQSTKPPTKAHQFLVSGIPFAVNRDSSTFQDLLEDGFEIADVNDPERWLSREYWGSTQAFGARLEERISPAAVAAVYRRCLAEVAGRPSSSLSRPAGRRPSGPPLVDRRRPATLASYARACRLLRVLGTPFEDAAPLALRKAYATCRNYVPGFVGCKLRDGRASRSSVVVSVLADVATGPRSSALGRLAKGLPETWELVASRSLRLPDGMRIRSKSLRRWPGRGVLPDRTIAAAQAEGSYLGFVPRLDADEIDWLAAAVADLESCPDVGLIRRERDPGPELDPAATFVVRRDVWRALGGYGQGAVTASPQCADLDLVQRVGFLGYRAAIEPAAHPRTAVPSRRTGGSGEIVIFTAVTGAYDRLPPLEERSVRPARRVAFLDEASRAHARETGSWDVHDVDWEGDDAVRRAKLPKVRPDLFFPDAEFSLWIDGNVRLTYPFGIERLIELHLQDADLCFFRHHARSCTYDEAEICKVRRADDPAVIDRQMARYRAEGMPARLGLHEGPVILRRHTAAVHEFDRLWWEEIARGSRRDQLSFEYVRWKTGLPIAEFPLAIQDRNGLFAKAPHRRNRRRPGTRDFRASVRRLQGFYFGAPASVSGIRGRRPG